MFILREVNYKSQNAPLCVSADGSLLAVGSHDNFIYLYTTSESGRKYSRYGKCTVSPPPRRNLLLSVALVFYTFSASENGDVMAMFAFSTGTFQLHHSPGLVT